jgi:hypothetical protein
MSVGGPRVAQVRIVRPDDDFRGASVALFEVRDERIQRLRHMAVPEIPRGDVGQEQHLGQQLAQLETATSPFGGDRLPRRGVHWVRPKLVAQAGFSEWTPGGKLRHPRFLGLRDDKKPTEVVKEG